MVCFAFWVGRSVAGCGLMGVCWFGYGVDVAEMLSPGGPVSSTARETPELVCADFALAGDGGRGGATHRAAHARACG